MEVEKSMIGINPDCPPGIALLADHLDASLAAGEDLLALSLEARADLDEVDPHGAPEALDAFVHRLLQLESSLVLRLLQARRLSVEIARADPTVKSVASLFRAQTDTLHDLIAGAGRGGDGALARAGDSHAYIRSRGLIAPEAAAPSPFEALSVDESFRVGGVAELGQILDFVSTTLDLLDIRFGLYMPDLPEDGVAAANVTVSPERGEAGAMPEASLANVLGMVRAGGAVDREVASARDADDSATLTKSDDAETATSAPGKSGSMSPRATGDMLPDEGTRSEAEPARSASAEVEQAAGEPSDAARKVDYRSLASLIAEVQRSTDRLSGGPNNAS